MISLYYVEQYCNNYKEIENYEEAISSKEMWECHHRLEIDGNTHRSRKELIALGLYYNRPASELIFLTKSEHNQLHKKGNKNPAWKGKVLCVETGKVYESASYVEVNLKIYINKALQGKCKTAGGFHWKYIGEGNV